MNFKRFDQYWKEISEKISWSILKDMVLHKSKCFGVTPWETVMSIFDDQELLRELPEEFKSEVVAGESQKYRKKLIIVGLASFIFTGVAVFFYGFYSAGENNPEKNKEIIVKNIELTNELEDLQVRLKRQEELVQAAEKKEKRWKKKFAKLQADSNELANQVEKQKGLYDELLKKNPETITLKQELSKALVDLDNSRKQLIKNQEILKIQEAKIIELKNSFQLNPSKTIDSSPKSISQLISLRQEIRNLKEDFKAKENTYQQKLASANLELRNLKDEIAKAPSTEIKISQTNQELRIQVEECSSSNQYLESRIKNLSKLLQTQRHDLNRRLQEERSRIELDEELVDKSFYNLSKKHYDLSKRYMNLIESLKPIQGTLTSHLTEIEDSGFKDSVASQDWPRIVAKSEIVAHSLEKFEAPTVKLEKILEKFSNEWEEQLVSKYYYP